MRARMPLKAVPTVPEITLHTASPTSGLRVFLDRIGCGRATPYWAYPWAGGLALARYVLDRPETVAGLRVLDLGSGSGLVAIAAALSGAREVLAMDADPCAVAAATLNALANGVALRAVSDDRAPSMSGVDVVLAGDVFYGRAVAQQTTRALDACLDAGMAVLVGDPGRPFLPRHRSRELAAYSVADVGDPQTSRHGQAFVFSWEPRS